MKFFQIANAALLATGLVLAQSSNPKVPKPKSNKEIEALNALFTAQDADGRIAAAEALVTKFADTEYKSLALYMATEAAASKNDAAAVMIYGERTLEADPKNFGAMITMARNLAGTTKEFDLDKEEKLSKAEKLANNAMTLTPTATKLNPNLTDEQWAAMKKDFDAQAHEALGMAAAVRKKYDAAAASYKLALENQMQKEPSTMLRLATVLVDAGKHDEAIAICDQVSAMADVPPQFKQVAGQQKLRAVTAKAAKK